MLSRFLNGLYDRASRLNRANIIELVRESGGDGGSLLDLGCDDGSWTMELAKACKARSVFGVEKVEDAARRAEDRGLTVFRVDLNAHLDELGTDQFDIVHANQVIEHVTNVDLFVAETFRILKPGGWAVVSTENGSSWHNVFAAIMGWQIFSSTNISEKMSGLGNPCALHRGKPPYMGTWTHKTIFNYRGLIEIFKAHAFQRIEVAGAGYFPLPAYLGRLDPRHSAFITVRAQKPIDINQRTAS